MFQVLGAQFETLSRSLIFGRWVLSNQASLRYLHLIQKLNLKTTSCLRLYARTKKLLVESVTLTLFYFVGSKPSLFSCQQRNSSLTSLLPGESKGTLCPFNPLTKENKDKQMKAQLSILEIWVLNFWYLLNELMLLLAGEWEQRDVTHAALLLLHNPYR